MQFSKLILLAAALPFALFGDASSKPCVGAEESYLRGVQCVDGDGDVKDYAAAARFYRQAAEAGHAPAQYSLAVLYERGWGVPLDLKEAAVWYRKAAEQGGAEAQNNLGALFAAGQGVERSDAEAVRWYRAAAKQDNLEATSNLAMMYLQGRGVPRDLDQAFELFQKAAERGYSVAQNNLALMYANGEPAARDFTWAYAWLDIAAEQLSGCAELRDRIGKQMTVGDIVLLSLRIPGKSGIEICRELRRQFPRLGILVLTAGETEEEKVEALDSGADDYITKPFHMRELQARVRAAMRRGKTPLGMIDALIRRGEIVTTNQSPSL